MKIPITMLAITALSACSDEAPPRAQAEQPAAVEGCIDRFVQEYEEVAADAAPADTQNVCFDGARPEGPPKYPTRSNKVRLEYDRGEYFAVKESADWVYEEPDVARGCVVARLKRSTVIKRVQGGVTESTQTEDGTTLRSADTGDQYGSSIRLGSGPGALPTLAAPVGANPAAQAMREESPYGTCLRTMPMLNSSLCSLEQPRECASSKVILPIEIRFPNAQGGTQVGRTTSLQRVTADRAAWVLP